MLYLHCHSDRYIWRSYTQEKDSKPSHSNLHLQKQSNRSTNIDEEKTEGNHHKRS